MNLETARAERLQRLHIQAFRARVIASAVKDREAARAFSNEAGAIDALISRIRWQNSRVTPLTLSSLRAT